MSEIEELRALADVDSPEVMHAAVKRLRRRVIVRIAWALVTLMAATSIAIYVYDLVRPPLARMGAPTGSTNHDLQAITVGGAVVGLVDAQFFGDYVGLHFVAMHPGVRQACVQVTPLPYTKIQPRMGSDGASECSGGFSDEWSYQGRPLRGRIRFVVSDGYPSQRLGSFVLIVPRPGTGSVQIEGVFRAR